MSGVDALLERPVLSSVEVCRRAGVSYRQLDYWIRCGVLTPSYSAHGSGTQRRFSEADALAVWVAGRLATLGARSAAMSAAVAAVLRRDDPVAPGVLLVSPSGSARVVDDEEIERMTAAQVARVLCDGWSVRIPWPSLDEVRLVG